MKLVVAKVQGGINRLERLEIDVDLSFLALRGQDFTTIYDQAIRRNLVIELQPLLGRGDGRKNGLPIDSGFDVRCRTLRRHQQRVKVRRKRSIHILQPTSSQPVKLDPLGLHALVSTPPCKKVAELTNNEGDHGSSISSSGFQALDELFHLPDFDILLGLVGLRVTHFGG